MKLRFPVFLSLLFASSICLGNHKEAKSSDMILDANAEKKVVSGVINLLDEYYVFPEVAKKIKEDLLINSAKYGKIKSAVKLAKTLTQDLQAISHDKHLRVFFRNDASARYFIREDESPEGKQKREEYLASINFDFQEVKRLDGNIGYLDFWGFASPELAGDTAAAAMNFLANTRALIIDLRKNGGGSPEMVAFLSTYFFPPEPLVHLNSLYWRKGDRTEEFWTLPSVPGKRYLNKDIYILTSKYTFSAAEEFCYNLQNLKRATIIGEVTKGGAHPGGPHLIGENFLIIIPTGRAINPISKTNWEGVGIQPDIKIGADKAFDKAYKLALEKLKETSKCKTSDKECGL